MKYIITIFLVLFSFTVCSEEEPAYKSWGNEIICDKAWYEGEWTDDPDLKDFVIEAKERNLDCRDPYRAMFEKKVQGYVNFCSKDNEKVYGKGTNDKFDYYMSSINYCLENVVIELTNNMTNQSTEETSQQIKNLRKGIIPLFERHWNGHKSCTPICGSLFASWPDNFYTQILMSVIMQIERSDYIRNF